MSHRETYALNTLSGVVSKIDPDLLVHPVLGANLVEVDEPNTCIGCGVQPSEVTTTDGKEIELARSAEVPVSEPASFADAPKPRKSKSKTNKEEKDG